jgi:hypothetical protein
MFENLKKFGEFSQSELDNNSIIECNECGKAWGIKKWNRVSTEQEMKCPGCGVVYTNKIEKTFFISYFVERPSSNFPNILKSSGDSTEALAITKAEDKLIERND